MIRTTHNHGSRPTAPAVAPLLLVTLLVVLGARCAYANPTRDGWGFGIADDSSAAVIAGTGFQQLGTKVFRFQVHYDADANEKIAAHAKIDAAMNAGVQSIMVTFTHGASDPSYRPTVEEWWAGVFPFVNEFDPLVDMWGVANEPNHKWLSGAHRADGPCRLAEYYWALYDELGRRNWVDELVSPEWHDDYASDGSLKTTVDEAGYTVSTVVHYIHHYLGCGGGWGHILGWHPYGGVARESSLSTNDFLNNTPSGMPVMLTEVGSTIYNTATGIFLTEGQQEHQVRWLVDTLANQPRIARVYYYQQRQPSGSLAWDSGLERCNGFLRPAWYTYCSAIHNGSCNPATVPPPGPCPDAYVPPDGGFWRLDDGSVYRIAGGSPIHLFSCAPEGVYPGCSNIFNFPETLLIQWMAQQPFPRDGTFLWHPNGAVFRVVGGALVYLSTCAAEGYFPGCSDLIALDGTAMNGLIDARARPRDGTLVRAPDGSVYRMECGDLAYVSDCADVGGCVGFIDLPGAAIGQLAAAAGCDDGNPCTADRCQGLTQCRHPLAAQCLEPILSVLLDGDCGDGVVDAGEECDDGNTNAGDCCSATCRFEAAGAPCVDANPCTAGDVCDASGHCTPGTCDTGKVCGPLCGGALTCQQSTSGTCECAP